MPAVGPVHHRRRFRSAAAARSGFSLLEMLIVLAILAALTTVAVQSLEPMEQKARSAASLKTLNAMRDGVISSNAQSVSGFIADTGLLPRDLYDLTGTLAFGAWMPPADLPAHGTLNISAGPDWNGSSWSVTAGGSGVALSRGWHGPYVMPPVGSGTLVDGWHTALSDTSRYFGATAPVVSSTSAVALLIRGSADLDDPPLTSIIPESQIKATQIVGTIYSPTSDTGPWCVMLVGPGLVSEGGYTVFSVTTTTVTSTGSPSPQPVATYSINGASKDLLGADLDPRALLVGPRLLGVAKGDASSASQAGRLQNIIVRPGSQTYDIYVP